MNAAYAGYCCHSLPPNISPHFTEVEGCRPRKERQPQWQLPAPPWGETLRSQKPGLAGISINLVPQASARARLAVLNGTVQGFELKVLT